MQQWDYLETTSSGEYDVIMGWSHWEQDKKLWEIGKDGWELVCAYPVVRGSSTVVHYIFKKPRT